MKVYQFRDQEVSEDAAIFAEAWYEALENEYESFSEFLTECVRNKIRPYVNGPCSEKVKELLKERGWANSHSFDVPRELYNRIEEIANEKGLTVDEYASELFLQYMKVKPDE